MWDNQIFHLMRVPSNWICNSDTEINQYFANYSFIQKQKQTCCSTFLIKATQKLKYFTLFTWVCWFMWIWCKPSRWWLTNSGFVLKKMKSGTQKTANQCQVLILISRMNIKHSSLPISQFDIPLNIELKLSWYRTFFPINILKEIHFSFW